MRVRVILDESPGVLVPTTAVSTLGGQNFVYVAKEPSEIENNNGNNSNSPGDNSQEQQIPEGALVAQQQPIKLGRIQNQDYQVISGLQEGDRIAVSNILSLQDGTAIEPAEEEVGSRK